MLVHGEGVEVGHEAALAVADVLAFEADEAAEAPGVEGDALGDDLLDVAVGVEVREDAGAVGEPFGLALDLGEDGRDGVDAVGGGVVAGDGFAFVASWSCLVWHTSMVGQGDEDRKSRMALFGELGAGTGNWERGGISFLRFSGLGYVMILE